MSSNGEILMTFILSDSGSSGCSPSSVSVETISTAAPVFSASFFSSFESFLSVSFDIIKTSDGGYAITGHSYSFGVGENDVWFIKIDSSGNMIFNQTYGGEMADSSRAVFQKSDGGYVIAGSTFSFGQGENDFWLIKTDENGIIPEFPSWAILPIIVTTSLLVITFKLKFKK